jgi:hypothetical protein
MFHLDELYIGVEKGKKCGKGISNSALLEVRLRMFIIMQCPGGFGGLGVSRLAFDTQVRGFKPDRSRRIFQGEKIPNEPSFGREVIPWVPYR